MFYVIAEPCVGTCDRACVQVCPVDCIAGPISSKELAGVPAAERAAKLKGHQLFIDPEICICCGACEPECPVDAIFDESELPAKWAHYAERNAAWFRDLAPR